MENQLQIFENQQIRSVWDEEKEEWYFSVIDVIGVLTGSENPRRYWSDLKRKLTKEGASELYENIVQLKLESSDRKKYKTDAATVEQLLRLIQSIPSPKAEPVKQWLARVGAERIDETIDPQIALDRVRATYLAKGYDKEWIDQRMMGIRIRNGLTDEWSERGVKDSQYGVLTDIIHRRWSDLSVKEHKKLKGLKKENLRDNMTTMELILTMLAEQTTTEISKSRDPKTMKEHTSIAKAGGEVARHARLDVERQTGQKVVTSSNAKGLLKKK